MTSTDKLMDILDEETDLKDAPDAEELYECKGEIEFKNVTFSYPTKAGGESKSTRKALKDVSFSVKPGQHVAYVCSLYVLPCKHRLNAFPDLDWSARPDLARVPSSSYCSVSSMSAKAASKSTARTSVKSRSALSDACWA